MKDKYGFVKRALPMCIAPLFVITFAGIQAYKTDNYDIAGFAFFVVACALFAIAIMLLDIFLPEDKASDKNEMKNS